MRIDACGEPIWTRTDLSFHHSLHPDERGGWWTWASAQSPEMQDQRLVRFAAETGETLEEIDLIDDIVDRSEAQRLILRIPEDYPFVRDLDARVALDIFHPNDVEPLPEALAAAFPMFAPGDLLISLRNLDLVAVIGRDTHEVRWAAYGPWFGQHDPDFQPDGRISVFDNNPQKERSEIILIDPATNAVENPFEGSGLRFSSPIMGKHQRTSTGNWLVISAEEGRVIEVTAKGEPVREYDNILTDRFNSVVSDARILPPDFYETLPACPPTGQIEP